MELAVTVQEGTEELVVALAVEPEHMVAPQLEVVLEDTEDLALGVVLAVGLEVALEVALEDTEDLALEVVQEDSEDLALGVAPEDTAALELEVAPGVMRGQLE